MKLIQISWFVASVMLFGISTEAQEVKTENRRAIELHRLAAANISEVAKKFEARVYINNTDTLLYRLFKPLNYNPIKTYPIVICLSGSGGVGHDNIRQLASCWPAQILSKEENQKRHPCFLLVPQCPNGKYWGITMAGGKGSAVPTVENLVLHVMKELESEFNIDTTRRYITGQSLGGYGTWHFILKYPDMFAAAVPICGGGDPSMVERIVNIPIWVFHGDKDSNVPVQYSREMIKAFKQAGGKPNYTEFKGVGHICWPLAYDTRINRLVIQSTEIAVNISRIKVICFEVLVIFSVETSKSIRTIYTTVI